MKRICCVVLLLTVMAVAATSQSITTKANADPNSVLIWQNEPDETPAKFMEVVYHQGNAYLKLDCGPGYEPYIAYWRNGKAIWMEGARLGRESDDFVLYSVPLNKRVMATDAYTGATTFFYDVSFQSSLTINNTGRLQGLYIKGDSLFLWVDGRKFALKETK